MTLQICFQSLIDDTPSCCKNVGREACWLVSSLSFFAIRTVRSMHRRGVHFLSFLILRYSVLVSLQCPWLSRCCSTRSHKQRRPDRFCPPLPTPGVTIYISDGAYQGQGTIVKTLTGRRVVFFLMSIPVIKLNLLPFFSVLFRALRLPDPHVLFEVDFDSCQTARTLSSLGLSFWKSHCSPSTMCTCF